MHLGLSENRCWLGWTGQKKNVSRNFRTAKFLEVIRLINPTIFVLWKKKGWVEDIQRKQTMICNMYVWSFCCKIFFPKTIHPFFNKKVWETNPRTEGKGSGGWVDVIHTTTQDEAEDPKKKAAANSSKGKNGKMEGWWRVTFEWWEQRKFDTNLWLDVDVLLDFFCWEQKGGRFCWSVKIGVIHVTTCQPGKRQLWRRSKDGCPQYDYRGLTHLRQLSLLQDKNKAPADPTKDRSLSVCRLGYFSCNVWFVLNGVFRWTSAVFWDVFSPQKQLREREPLFEGDAPPPTILTVRSQEIVKGIIFFLGGDDLQC